MNKQPSTSELFSEKRESATSVSAGDVFRPTEELVIGVVGAIGSGISRTAKKIKDILEGQYDYSVEIIKASDIIRENAKKTSCPEPAEVGSARIRDLQIIGTELRRKFEEGYIAAKAIEKIAARRDRSDAFDEAALQRQPKRLRRATIIDSLKHQEETRLFRNVYGDIYWQFTVFAPPSIRADRLLEDPDIERSDLDDIFERDKDDKEEKYGQKVSKTAHLSDFFIRNDKKDEGDSSPLTRAVERYLEIIFNISIHTPTADEAGMYAALSAAKKSACLSRQVGAALYSSDRELISVGWNDVPKASGGLYLTDDKKDYRCFRWKGGICHNDKKKEDLYTKIFDKLKAEGLLARKTDKEKLRSALMGTPVRDLIEYSRSIHAEMEAIVSAGRTGKVGMVGGTLYTTTFPCHNCARHIVAAGISKVYYIEPYPKSLASELHSDAIKNVEEPTEEEPTEKDEKKVAFIQYEGVGPKSALRLFHYDKERKIKGKVPPSNKRTACPVLQPPMDGFATHERLVMLNLEKIEENHSPKGK